MIHREEVFWERNLDNIAGYGNLMDPYQLRTGLT